MIRSLVQYEQDGRRGVAALDDGGSALIVRDTVSVRMLAGDALA